MMLLSTLPPDGIRPILLMLDVNSLVHLFATFDRKIQRMLTLPNSVFQLDIWDGQTLAQGAMRYFVSSLAGVKRLTLHPDGRLPLGCLKLVSSLYPTELVLHDALISFTKEERAKINSTPGILELPLQSADNELIKQIQASTPPLLPTTLHIRDGLIDLLLHFPNIQSLVVKCSFDKAFHTELGLWIDYEQFAPVFPPSLTSVHFEYLEENMLKHIIKSLPATLRRLSLVEEDLCCLDAIFGRFTSLEHLRIADTSQRDGYRKNVNTAGATSLHALADVPKTLHTLQLPNSDVDVFRLLDSYNFKHSQLRSFEFGTNRPLRSDEARNFAYLLPASLLHLAIGDGSQVYTQAPSASRPSIVIPPSLAKLIIVAPNIHCSIDFLPSASNLRIFKLTAKKSRVMLIHESDWSESCTSAPPPRNGFSSRPPIPISKSIIVETRNLPRSLTELEVTSCNDMSEAAICDLPSSLLRLRVDNFPLARHHLLAKTSPMCALCMAKSVKFWFSDNGAWLMQGKFDSLQSTHLDLNALYNEVLSWARRSKISLVIDATFPDTNDFDTVAQYPKHIESLSIVDSPADPIKSGFFCPRAFLEYLVDLKSVVVRLDSRSPMRIFHLPPCLTDLDFSAPCVFSISQHAHLTRLTSSSVADNAFVGELPNLTHLDTPHWTFEAVTMLTWNFKNMDKLNCTLRNIADYNVIDFLTKAVSPKTRSNMSVALGYYVSGILLPDFGEKALRDVTWSAICDETETILKARLSSPMVSASGSGSTRNTTEPVDTIGSVLRSIERDSFRSGDAISIPRSAVTVVLNYGARFRLADASNYNSKGLSMRPQSIPVQPIYAQNPEMSFGTKIVLLDLVDVLLPEKNWINKLPPSLLHLNLKIDSLLGSIAIKSLPQNLETFILDTELRRSSFIIGFDLSALPASLKHFAFIGTSLEPQTNEQETIEAKLTLPNLKTFYTSLTSRQSLFTLIKRLPIESMDQFAMKRKPDTTKDDAERRPLDKLIASYGGCHSRPEAWKSASSYKIILLAVTGAVASIRRFQTVPETPSSAPGF